MPLHGLRCVGGTPLTGMMCIERRRGKCGPRLPGCHAPRRGASAAPRSSRAGCLGEPVLSRATRSRPGPAGSTDRRNRVGRERRLRLPAAGLVADTGWAPRRDKPVVRKAMVDLNGPVFKHFAALRERWALEDCYRWAHGPPLH